MKRTIFKMGNTRQDEKMSEIITVLNIREIAIKKYSQDMYQQIYYEFEDYNIIEVFNVKKNIKKVYVIVNVCEVCKSPKYFLSEIEKYIQKRIMNNQIQSIYENLRYGYLDLVKLKFVCSLVGATNIIINNCWVISNFDRLKLVCKYIYNHEGTKKYVFDSNYIKNCKPVYSIFRINEEEIFNLMNKQEEFKSSNDYPLGLKQMILEIKNETNIDVLAYKSSFEFEDLII